MRIRLIDDIRPRRKFGSRGDVTIMVVGHYYVFQHPGSCSLETRAGLMPLIGRN